jgi:hypothetical protein
MRYCDGRGEMMSVVVQNGNTVFTMYWYWLVAVVVAALFLGMLLGRASK